MPPHAQQLYCMQFKPIMHLLFVLIISQYEALYFFFVSISDKTTLESNEIRGE